MRARIPETEPTMNILRQGNPFYEGISPGLFTLMANTGDRIAVFPSG